MAKHSKGKLSWLQKTFCGGSSNPFDNEYLLFDIKHLQLRKKSQKPQKFSPSNVLLHFSQIESLKDLVILSPNWLAKLFSYIIAAQSYNTGGEYDWAWKRLTKYGILHECLLQHMLDKFPL